jgi:hypothetical protein
VPQSEYSEAQRGSIDAHACSGTDTGGGTAARVELRLVLVLVLMLDTANSALAPKSGCSAALVVAVLDEAEEGDRAPRKVLSLKQ